MTKAVPKEATGNQYRSAQQKKDLLPRKKMREHNKKEKINFLRKTLKVKMNFHFDPHTFLAAIVCGEGTR